LAGVLNTAERNIAVGEDSGNDITTGDDNVLVGYSAGAAITSGKYNVFIGNYAGLENEDGHKNIFIGGESGEHDDAGADATSPDNCIAIGFQTRFDTTTPSNEIIIGHLAEGQGDNTVTLGDENVTAVYMSQDSGASVTAAQ
jgi:hypothetical protein